MAIFSYVARDINGEDHKGTIETVDIHQASRLLVRKGLVVISVKETSAQNKNSIEKYLNRVSFGDLVVATRQLATMIESGLVLSESLDILAEQQTNKTFKSVLGEVSRDVKGGLDLATALRKHPDVFPPLYSSLVKAGEQAGKLDTILTQMATNLERDREFRARIKGAMMYPIVVVVMMIAVVAIMMFFVIPRLISLYAQSNIELPLPTKILIVSSNIATTYWWAILGGMIVGFIAFRRWIATPSGKLAFDTFILKVPVVGKIVQGSNLTNFTRTFGLLTTAGVPLLDALQIVTEVIGNAKYRMSFKQAAQGVERGLNFSQQLNNSPVFPKIIPQMYRVGEETGKVDKVSFKLADYFESETDNLVKNITVIIEPVVLVLLGIGVAFLVLSIILPIYKLTTSFT